MSMEWWYVKNGERLGPVSQDDLKAMANDGRLLRSDLIWNSTMGSNWKKAAEVEGIFTIPPAAPAAGADPGAAKAPEPAPVISEISAPRPVQGTSVMQPFEPAWHAMVRILFKPFSFAKWLALGFCAFLAALYDSGYQSGGMGAYSNPGTSAFMQSMQAAFSDMGTNGSSVFDQWGALVAGIGIVVVVVLLAIGILFLWLQARGKFMMLDNVLRNDHNIRTSWTTFSQHGNSLFRWYIVFNICVWIVWGVIIAIGAFSVAIPWFKAGRIAPTGITTLVVLGCVAFCVMVIYLYIVRFLEDFVVPIMYKHNMTASEAWSFFGKLYRGNTGKLILYGLFWVPLGIVAGIASGIIGATLMVATCCILGVLSYIPVLGQLVTSYVFCVALLPVLMLLRFYGLYYAAQYGPDFDLVTGAECSSLNG